MIFHKNLASGTWQSLSLMEQLANVGSEVERAIKWRSKNKEYEMLACYRALELLDLTIHDPKNRASLREILRARELFCDFMLGENVYGSTDRLWQTYFMAFTIAAYNKKH